MQSGPQAVSGHKMWRHDQFRPWLEEAYDRHCDTCKSFLMAVITHREGLHSMKRAVQKAVGTGSFVITRLASSGV